MSAKEPLFFPLVSSSQQTPSQTIEGFERQIGPTYSTLPISDVAASDNTKIAVWIYHQVPNCKFIHATNNSDHHEVPLETIHMSNGRDMCLRRLLDDSALFLQSALYASAPPRSATSQIKHLQSFEAMLFDSFHECRHEFIRVLANSRIVYERADWSAY